MRILNEDEWKEIVEQYIADARVLLGADIKHAVVYGSVARGDSHEDSDIDIAIFTERPSRDFYQLINKIAELTFEYNVKYDIILSPVFQNMNDYQRMVKVLPYYQNIQKEGIAVG